MNESKVVRYDLKLEHCDLIKEDRSGRYVTQADYKALEEENEKLKSDISVLEDYNASYRKMLLQSADDVMKLTANLDSLKARVAELVEAEKEMKLYATSEKPIFGFQNSLHRRRLALEALK